MPTTENIAKRRKKTIMKDLDDIRATPIEDVAKDLGIVVGRHKALCPFHPDKLKEIEDVTTVEQAIDYLASEYGVVAKTKLKAINEAHKHGIDFPNLK